MKNKTLKFILIMAIFILSFLLMTKVRAEISWDSESNTVTIPYGESISSYLEIDDYIDTTGRAQTMNQYSIISNEGTQIFTGWNQAMGQNNNNSYYGRMNVATNTIGQQTMTIRFTPSGNGTPVETTLTINCVGSEDLKTVIESLGGEMPNEYTLDTDDIYTSLDELTGTQYEAILDANEAYNALGTAEKALVDQIISDKLNMTADEVQQAAEDGIENLANDFLESNRLTEENVENNEDLEDVREILSNATTLDDEFNSLSPRTQAKVLEKLSDDEIQVNSWEEVEAICNEQIDMIDAVLFIQQYIEYTDEGINDDKVIAGEEDWNNLKDEVKELVNQALLSIEEIGKTYPELLIEAKANKFLSDNLTTEDGQVIVESNNYNYKQIIDAKDDYEALSDEVKEAVNRILTEKGNTTYPELLKDAQKLEPTPKTGDMFVVMITILVASVVGLSTTYIIKRKK